VVGGRNERLWFLGTLAIVRVPREAVDGRFAVIEFLLPSHASPPLHTHPQPESYIVLDGQLTVHAGADRFELRPGGIGLVPTGVAHTFLVNSDTARVLVLSTPAAIERFIRDGSVLATSATLPPPDTPRPTLERLGRSSEPTALTPAYKSPFKFTSTGHAARLTGSGTPRSNGACPRVTAHPATSAPAVSSDAGNGCETAPASGVVGVGEKPGIREVRMPDQAQGRVVGIHESRERATEGVKSRVPPAPVDTDGGEVIQRHNVRLRRTPRSAR
jgi:quercetin dioxygenase-like cupin family protein